MADTLSCQWETLHSQQLRSIKKSIDSDHGIYRYCEGRFKMKLPHRRQFLHLAAGAAALPSVSCLLGRKPIRRGRCAGS